MAIIKCSSNHTISDSPGVSPQFSIFLCPAFVLDAMGVLVTTTFIDKCLLFVESNVDPVSKSPMFSVSFCEIDSNNCSSSGEMHKMFSSFVFKCCTASTVSVVGQQCSQSVWNPCNCSVSICTPVQCFLGCFFSSLVDWLSTWSFFSDLSLLALWFTSWTNCSPFLIA